MIIVLYSFTYLDTAEKMQIFSSGPSPQAAWIYYIPLVLEIPKLRQWL